MTDTLDALDDEAAFEEVLRRAKANSAGKRWLFMAGGVRCEDGRCPLEAAADVGRNELRLAMITLWPQGWFGPLGQAIDDIVRAADSGMGGERVTRWRMRLIMDMLTEVPW